MGVVRLLGQVAALLLRQPIGPDLLERLVEDDVVLLVGVDEEKRVMLIHAIDAADPDAVRESQQEFYRRYQRRVFP